MQIITESERHFYDNVEIYIAVGAGLLLILLKIFFPITLKDKKRFAARWNAEGAGKSRQLVTDIRLGSAMLHLKLQSRAPAKEEFNFAFRSSHPDFQSIAQTSKGSELEFTYQPDHMDGQSYDDPTAYLRLKH